MAGLYVRCEMMEQVLEATDVIHAAYLPIPRAEMMEYWLGEVAFGPAKQASLRISLHGIGKRLKRE